MGCVQLPIYLTLDDEAGRLQALFTVAPPIRAYPAGDRLSTL